MKSSLASKERKVLHNGVSNTQLSRYSSVLAFDESLHRSTDTLLFRKTGEHFWENKPEISFSSLPACKLSRTDADRTRVDVKMFPIWDQRRHEILPVVPLLSMGCHCYAFENTILMRKGNENRCRSTDPSASETFIIFFSVEPASYIIIEKNISAEFASLFTNSNFKLWTTYITQAVYFHCKKAKGQTLSVVEEK